MAKLLFVAAVSLLCLSAPVSAQENPEDETALSAAEALGNGFSPASPLFSRNILDSRQTYRCVDAGYYPCSRTLMTPINVAAVDPDGAAVRPIVVRLAQPAVMAAVVSIQAESAVGMASLAVLALITTTITRTRIEESTTTTTRTITPPPEEQPSGFTCSPMTVTNSVGDSLELGNDCALKFSPAETASVTATVEMLRVRQNICPPTRTTATVYETIGTNDVATITATVTAEKSPPRLGFTCAPMTATNSLGDELAIDNKCSLQLSLSEPTVTPKSNAAGRIDMLGMSRCTVLGSIFASLVGLYA
ncbi:hypothetical protein PABG_12370 [Paracoccidioides brasiliensis Pb03]|nr:hypothetical protein PABG_12370 [Paracoccidioides brasiliensis Pb03]